MRLESHRVQEKEERKYELPATRSESTEGPLVLHLMPLPRAVTIEGGTGCKNRVQALYGLGRGFDGMAEAPLTQPSLLVRLADKQDREAWARFVEIYAPLIYGHARKYGLQDADAADLTQDVLRAVAAAMGGFDYDPSRGSFRGWLFTVVRNLLRNFLASRRSHHQASGAPGTQAFLEAQPARDDELARSWDQEYQQRLFLWAAEQIRGDFQDRTWQAFWQTAIEGKSVKTVAQALDMSVGAVYVAKSRVLARLREQ